MYAKRPLDKRLHKLRVKTTMILAECSWVPRISEEEMRTCMGPSGRLDYMVSGLFKDVVLRMKIIWFPLIFSDNSFRIP